MRSPRMTLRVSDARTASRTAMSMHSSAVMRHPGALESMRYS